MRTISTVLPSSSVVEANSALSRILPSTSTATARASTPSERR
jgi:hypothetical protein